MRNPFRRREPDFIIGGADNPYMRRWWLIPRNTRCNLYLHHFCRSDDDRALHDHPWWNVSILLRGSYIEQMPDVAPRYALNLPGYMEHPRFRTALRRPFRPVFRRAEAAHRIELLRDEAGQERPVWTLFITGPRVREWGFWCPRGWRHWTVFTNPADGGATVGRGCDD